MAGNGSWLCRMLPYDCLAKSVQEPGCGIRPGKSPLFKRTFNCGHAIRFEESYFAYSP